MNDAQFFSYASRMIIFTGPTQPAQPSFDSGYSNLNIVKSLFLQYIKFTMEGSNRLNNIHLHSDLFRHQSFYFQPTASKTTIKRSSYINTSCKQSGLVSIMSNRMITTKFLGASRERSSQIPDKTWKLLKSTIVDLFDHEKNSRGVLRHIQTVLGFPIS
jgi:hypothetical protein